MKIVECEFLQKVYSHLITVGLDDNTSDMNLLRTEKANISALKDKYLEVLISEFGDEDLQKIIDVEELDLSQLFKVNPKKNKALWAVNYPIMAFLLLAQLHRLREKQFEEKKLFSMQEKVKRAIEFAFELDTLFTIVEKMLFIDFHEEIKNFNKKAIINTLVVVFQNKHLEKDQKVFDTLPFATLDLLLYPSLYNPFLTARYLDTDPQQPLPSNPFLIDFTKDLNILGKAKQFQKDPEVKRKAICKTLYLNRKCYENCFYLILKESENFDRKQSSLLFGGTKDM